MCLSDFPGAWGSRDVDDVAKFGVEFLKAQRAVIEGGGEPKAKRDEALFAGPVAVIHRAHLRNCLVRLIDDHEKVFGEVIHKAMGRLPFAAPIKVAGVVFNPFAKADLPNHFEIVAGPLFGPLGFDEGVIFCKVLNTLLQFLLDGINGARKHQDLFLTTDKPPKSQKALTKDLRSLEAAMRKAAKELNFEEAARLRDRLKTLRNLEVFDT